ncbi:hypothetical protein ACFVRU_15865, partial [Streptomyces sp. NPDC057927]
MDLTVVAYVIYLLVSIALTVWVARTLSHNGRIFLADVLHGNEKLADAVNHLLVVGFYLVNLGFVALYLNGAEHGVFCFPSIEADCLEAGGDKLFAEY